MLILVVIVLVAYGFKERAPEYITSQLTEQEKVERLSKYETEVLPQVYLVKKEGEKTAVIQKIICQGYNGRFDVLVTISIPEKALSSISILNHKETSDYGGYLTEDWFLKRFIGKTTKQTLQLVKIINRKPEEIVAITGATITSRGVLTGVNQAFENFNKIIGGIIGEEN